MPEDYKEFIRVYGTGAIDNFAWVFNPFSVLETLNLSRQLHVVRDIYTELYSEFQEPRLPIFPEKEGLLPFAVTDNGDYLFWKTARSLQHWTIVVGASREPKYEHFACSTSIFLEGILTGRLKSRIFPADFPSTVPKFTPK